MAHAQRICTERDRRCGCSWRDYSTRSRVCVEVRPPWWPETGGITFLNLHNARAADSRIAHALAGTVPELLDGLGEREVEVGLRTKLSARIRTSRDGRTYVVTDELGLDAAGSVELDNDALVEVLGETTVSHSVQAEDACVNWRFLDEVLCARIRTFLISG